MLEAAFRGPLHTSTARYKAAALTPGQLHIATCNMKNNGKTSTVYPPTRFTSAGTKQISIKFSTGCSASKVMACCVNTYKLLRAVSISAINTFVFLWNVFLSLLYNPFPCSDDISAGRMMEEIWEVIEWRKGTCALKMRNGALSLPDALLFKSASTISWNTARGRTENLTELSQSQISFQLTGIKHIFKGR
jgi:hypothetical protein